MSEAKDRILQAAIGEFGTYGYKTASTNRIMVSAGVSKGLIFHYYGSKKQLYMTCVQHVIKAYLDEYDKILDKSEKDFYIRYKNIVEFKTKFIMNNPSMGRFLVSMNKVYHEKSIPEFIEYTKKIYTERWNILISNVDTSKYRKNLPAEKVFDYIKVVMDAYAQRYHFEQMSYEEVIESLDDYFREMKVVEEIFLYGIYSQFE